VNGTVKILIVVALVVAVAVVIAARYRTAPKDNEPALTSQQSGSTNQPAVQINNYSSQQGTEQETSLPRLVDLGSDTCIPCKMMAPVLEELKSELAGKLNVEFLNVHENPNFLEHYNIRIIPTQIFYDAAGKELFRHQGFYSKEDILAEFRELGIDFE